MQSAIGGCSWPPASGPLLAEPASSPVPTARNCSYRTAELSGHLFGGHPFKHLHLDDCSKSWVDFGELRERVFYILQSLVAGNRGQHPLLRDNMVRAAVQRTRVMHQHPLHDVA